jgi:AbrB family looped-hinge helix DNA binding protein
MPSATVTSKGQITIPMDVRHRMNVNKGDRVELIEIGPGRYEFVAATHNVRELKGMIGKPSKKVSIDEMNKAIGRPGAGPA